MPVDPEMGKVHIGNVNVSIGMLSMLGGLYTITKTNAGKDEETKLVCPDCDNPTQFPSQKYICSEDATHVHPLSEMGRGRQVGDKIVRLNAQEIAEARKSVLPEKDLQLQVHRREDVEAHTFPKGNAYVLVPTGKSPLGSVLRDLLLKRRDLCLMAKTNLRGADHLIMLDVELNGQLVIREMMWPEDMKHFPQVIEDTATPKLVAQAEMLVDASVEDFQEDEYRKDSRERLASILDAAASGQAPSKAAAKKEKKSTQVDLSSQLEAAIAAAQAKKKTA